MYIMNGRFGSADAHVPRTSDLGWGRPVYIDVGNDDGRCCFRRPFQRDSDKQRKKKRKEKMCRAINISCILIMVVVLLLLPHGTFSIPSKEVNEICSTTPDPSFCSKSLSSNPGTGSADLPRLAGLSIDMAKASASSTSAMVATLGANATNSKLKSRYRSCQEIFDDSISSLLDSSNSLSTGDYKSMNSQISAAMKGADTCMNKFEGPPEDSSQLPNKCKELKSLCSIVLAIGKRLMAL